jgi:DNA-directed RNA polymerase specialized sigma24 family protein
MNDPRHHSFQTTRWSLIEGIQRASDPGLTERSLAEICRRYWFPIYAFVRRSGAGPEDAEDSTQSFFEHLLRGDLLERAREERGRLRSYLLACLKHFLGNQWKRESRQRRGGGMRWASFERLEAEERLRLEEAQAVGGDLEVFFDREWAHGVLEQVVDRLRLESGQGAERVRLEVLLPALSREVDREELMRATGMTEGALKVALHRLRRRYGRVLREVVEESVAEASEVEGELAHLFACLRRLN